jgi:hypothetical protein
MPEHQHTGGLQAVTTAHVHYQFHWMGDHWKQEIVGVGGCQAIPLIWSIEGQVARDGHLTTASPTYEHLDIREGEPPTIVARLSGEAGPRHYSATFTFEERPDEVAVDVEVDARGGDPAKPTVATYLIESSDGHLERGEAATITWTNPETRLVFEAVPPARVEAHEAGMGTIRLKAIGALDPSGEAQKLRYRWRWVTVPGHQIWDREV